MVRDEDYDIYRITIEKRLDTRKILILILTVMILICLVMIIKNSIEIINHHKVYTQYEAQLVALKKQEEDKIAEIEKEKERIKQERIPKLTQQRKR